MQPTPVRKFFEFCKPVLLASLFIFPPRKNEVKNKIHNSHQPVEVKDDDERDGNNRRGERKYNGQNKRGPHDCAGKNLHPSVLTVTRHKSKEA